jgi:hypothetical protein
MTFQAFTQAFVQTEGVKPHSWYSELQEIDERLEAISPVDLLSFVVSTAVITDANLVDTPSFGARDLRTYFNFEAKVV